MQHAPFQQLLDDDRKRRANPMAGAAFMTALEPATLRSMDTVRFGRALGVGARAAAKTLITAVDAAAAPNPSSASKPRVEQKTQTPVTEAGTRQQAARTAAQVLGARQALKRGSRRFGEAVWGPFVRLSGVLWLEMTGVFFGIFAVFAGGGAWKMRGAIRETAANQDAHARFLWAVVMAAVFGYFCATSFLKARRKGQGR